MSDEAFSVDFSGFERSSAPAGKSERTAVWRRIQDWLGHRSIQHTTRYTQLSAAAFKDFWR
jgi:integrase